MAKPTPQQCHALTTYFINAYEKRFSKAAVVNRNRARWGFESLLMDYSPVVARDMIDFYINHWDDPTLDWFLFNYDKVDVAKTEHDAQELSRAKRRAETAKRLEEWRNRWKK